jgi:threonine/homoserine/homoserine lactone efflux protein
MTELLAPLLALVVLTVLPGPDVAVVTRVALSSGRSAALRASAGILSGLLVWGLLTVAGLAALLAASATAYTVVKLAGAAYLVWLGVQALRGRAAEKAPKIGERHFRTGLTSNVLNPKIAVFYSSLLPSLVPEGAPHALTLMGLVLAHALMGVLWLGAISIALARAAGGLQRPGIRRALERITGTVLIAFGARVAAEAR